MKKEIFKKWWFWLVLSVLVIIIWCPIVASITGNTFEKPTTLDNNTTNSTTIVNLKNTNIINSTNVNTNITNEITNTIEKPEQSSAETQNSMNTNKTNKDSSATNANSNTKTSVPSASTSTKITETKETTTSNSTPAKTDTSTKSNSNNNSSQSKAPPANTSSKEHVTVENDKISGVWIGETGTKYHNKDCRTLKGNKYEISLEEAKRQGRTSCKVCH